MDIGIIVAYGISSFAGFYMNSTFAIHRMRLRDIMLLQATRYSVELLLTRRYSGGIQE